MLNSKKKLHKQLVKILKQHRGSDIDDLFHTAHEEVFENIDCLSCGNCCKTTSPLFTYVDIDRISKFLKLKPGSFISTYLHTDEDNDLVLNVTPCPFIDDQNYCAIYDVRPKACRDYPHTNRKKQSQLLQLNLKNTEICPAVFEMFEKIRSGI